MSSQIQNDQPQKDIQQQQSSPKEILDVPTKCLAFSPNWYQQMICSYDALSGLVAFGCNNDVYVFNYPLKKYETIIGGANMHGKVTCLYFHRLQNAKLILFTGNSANELSLFSFEDTTRQFCLLDSQIIPSDHPNTTISQISSILSEKESNSLSLKIRVCFQNGGVFEFSLNEHALKFQSMKPLVVSSNNFRLKQMVEVNNMTLFLFEEGYIHVYDINQLVLIHQIDGRLLACDVLNSKDLKLQGELKNEGVVLLVKSKGHLKLIEIQIQRKLNKTGNYSYLLEETLHAAINFVYTKKKAELAQSSYSLKGIDQNLFILTGKIGDIYIFNIQRLKQAVSAISQASSSSASHFTITINPLSAQFQESYFSKVPDSRHDQGIFTVLHTSDNKIITIATDRKITFFHLNSKEVLNNETIINPTQQNNEQVCFPELEFEWQLNCLGGKVSSLATSQVEKELIFLNCIDHSIRLWDSSKTHDQLYIKEYSRHLDRCSAKELVLHLSLENVIIILREDRLSSLIGYDLSKEKIFFEYDGGREILSVRWVKRSSVEEISNLCFSSLKSEELESTSKRTQLQPDQFQWKDKIINLDNGEEDPWCMLVLKKGGYISLIDLIDKKILLEDYLLNETKQIFQNAEFSILKGNTLFVVLAQLGLVSFYSDYSYKSIENVHKNIVKSIVVKQINNSESAIVCCGSADRRISVFTGDITDVQSFQLKLYLKHEHPIERVRFSPHEQLYLLLAICSHHNTIQVYDLDNIANQKSIDAETSFRSFEMKNIRGHRGYVNDAIFSPLDKSLIISCSDDQTVKFWNLNSITNRSYPKVKKNKKQFGKEHFQEDNNS